ncbi:DUF3553 domain-containing protein [Streptomyces sp. NPDC055089]
MRHCQWGDGLVMSQDGRRLTVLFETAGYRTLSLDVVEQNGLLTLR